MNPEPNSMRAVLRHPSALLPMIMSMAALAAVIFHLLLSGAARQPDEGAAAHLWQILMAGQLPVIAWFAVRWLRQAPRNAYCVLAMQAGAALAAMLPVYLLNW